MSETTGKGVHSEVGQLRKVLVCAPGLAHRRLTPSNCDDLLFDDVMWVESAQRDHADFVSNLRGNGVEVLELQEVLTQTMAQAEARQWLLERKVVPNVVGGGLVEGTRAYLDSLDEGRLSELLLGGMATSDLPEDYRTDYVNLARESRGIYEYLMPPLPNTLYTRDTTCWIYGGVTLNPLYWDARRDETLLMKAIYKFHPEFRDSTIWWGGSRTGVGPGDRGGRGCDAGGQRGGADRHERAHLPPRHYPAGLLTVPPGGGRARDRGRDAEAACGDAPGYRVHLRGP